MCIRDRYDVASASMGMGGGGWLESGAMHPTNPDKVMLGADVSFIYYSEDRGQSFRNITKGSLTREDREMFYTPEIVGIDNSEFSGFVIATSGGMFSFEIDAADTVVCMTPIEDPTGMYLYEADMGWGKWLFSVPFTDLSASSNNEYLVASAGKYRWLQNEAFEDIKYPMNYVEVNYKNPVGRQGLWYYNYDEGSASRKWRPIELGHDAWQSAHGIYRAIDVSIAGTDTVIALASAKAGPQLLKLQAGGTRTWVDLASYPWNRFDGTTVTPTWGQLPSTSSNIQTTSSIYLTDRMTAYVCVVNLSNDWTGNSGVYRMHDVLNPTTWEWVGDQTLMPWVDWGGSGDQPVNWYTAGGGRVSSIRATFNYVSVAEGSSSAPDTLFIGDRYWLAGLSRVVTPYGEGALYDQLQTWIPMEWIWSAEWEHKRMPEASFDVISYNDDLGWSGLMIEPIINPKNSNEVIIQDNVVLLHTDDGGLNWDWLEPKKPILGNPNFNQTGGYNEACMNDITILSDGRLVLSQGDIGLAVSYSGENWDAFENLSTTEVTNSNLDPATCDSDLSALIASYTTYGVPTAGIDTDLVRNTYETVWAHTEPNWNGTGRDALFYVAAKYIGKQGLGSIVMYHDSDGDGTWESTSVNTNALSPLRYKYGYYFNCETVRDGNNFTIYVPYIEATTSACSPYQDFVDLGVHKFTFNGTTWSMSELSTFSDFDWGDDEYTTSGYSPRDKSMWPWDIVWSSEQNKLYLSVIANNYYPNNSGLFEMDLKDTNPMWVPITGLNSFSGQHPTDNRGYAIDPRTLQMSEDGSTLYVTVRGEQAGYGGVLKITNLGNDVLNDEDETKPMWSLPTIKWVLNNPDKSTPWLPMTPSRYGEITVDHERDILGRSALKDTRANGVLINPENKHQIWITCVPRNPNNIDGGLWALDTTRNVLTNVLSADQSGEVSFSDNNIVYDPYHTPNRIVIGTDCVGAYYINYDGVFHTDYESVTTPLPTPYTGQEYPPTGLWVSNGSNSVTVHWNYTPNYKQNGTTGYNIYRSTTVDGTYTKLNVSVYNPLWSNTVGYNYVDTTAVNGNTYYYKVKTAYGASEGGFSLPVVANPVAP